MFVPGLIRINLFFERIWYHLVQIIDEIRNLSVCELHSSWHKQVVKPNGHSLRRSCEHTTWPSSNSRTDITANGAAAAAAGLQLSDLFFSLIACKWF